MNSKYVFPFFASLITLTGCAGEDKSSDPATSTDAMSRAHESGPVACAAVVPECGPGERIADVDGDGCALECETVSCAAVIPECAPGEHVADVDGDGCALECE